MSNQVIIQKQDHFGNGITQMNGKLVFVDQALKDEVVEVCVIGEKKKFYHAKISKIIHASKDRILPPCPFYESCGGCQLQHQKYASSVEWKMEKVREILKKFAHYEGRVSDIKKTNEYAYRNKVTLKVEKDSLCLTRDKTNDLVAINRCLLLPDKMNALILAINSYLKVGQAFSSIQIRMNQKNQFQLSLFGTVDFSLFSSYLNDFSIISIYQDNRLVYGSDDFQDFIFGYPFYLSPKAFFQVNRNQIETLYRLVLDEVEAIKPKKLLDLYCGVGTLGILTSKYVEEVVGIEVVHDAIVSANRNKVINSISNISFYESKVEDIIPELVGYDFWIVDPPRRGLDEKTKQIMLKYLPKAIVYVSCDVVTLARDLSYLQEKYDIVRVTPVDMFPNTYHVECVCVLKLRKAL